MTEEIQILIKAVDEVSATLKNVETKLTNFSENTQKSSDKVTSSFTEQTKKLIAVGNAAASVDRIFSSYTNLQLRLENASERVANAQDRLRTAQEKLNVVQSETERRALSLQRLGLDEQDSKVKLAKLTEDLADMTKRKVLPSSEKYQETLKNIQREELNLKDIQLTAKEAQVKHSRDLVSAQQDVESATRSLTISENNLARANNAVIGTYINMGLQTATLIGQIPTLTASVGGAGGLTSAMGTLGATVGVGGLAATLGVAGALVGLGAVMYALGPTMTETDKRIAEQVISLEKLAAAASGAEKAFYQLLLQEAKVNKTQSKSGTDSTIISQPPKYSGTPASGFDAIGGSWGNTGVNVRAPVIVGDGIIKPSGQVIKTDPKDTLIAMKDVSTSVNSLTSKNMEKGSYGGITLVIEGNIYGTDPDEMAEAIFKKLRRKVAI